MRLRLEISEWTIRYVQTIDPDCMYGSDDCNTQSGRERVCVWVCFVRFVAEWNISVCDSVFFLWACRCMRGGFMCVSVRLCMYLYLSSIQNIYICVCIVNALYSSIGSVECSSCFGCCFSYDCSNCGNWTRVVSAESTNTICVLQMYKSKPNHTQQLNKCVSLILKSHNLHTHRLSVCRSVCVCGHRTCLCLGVTECEIVQHNSTIPRDRLYCSCSRRVGLNTRCRCRCRRRFCRMFHLL